MASIAFPSWAFSATQPAQIVASQAAFTALGAGWAFTPFPPPVPIAAIDTTPVLTATDTRLQQLVVEARITNQYLYANLGSQGDDPQALRSDVVVTDIALSS